MQPIKSQKTFMSVLRGVGDGTLLAPLDHPVGSPLGLDVGDLDEDGVADLVAANRDGHLVQVLVGLGDGTFVDGVSGDAATEYRSRRMSTSRIGSSSSAHWSRFSR